MARRDDREARRGDRGEGIDARVAVPLDDLVRPEVVTDAETDADADARNQTPGRDTCVETSMPDETNRGGTRGARSRAA
jgi:hypothetical protein